jgi:hypothetical protein
LQTIVGDQKTALHRDNPVGKVIDSLVVVVVVVTMGD